MRMKWFLKWGTPSLSLLILLYCTWIYFCPFVISAKHGQLTIGSFFKALLDSREYYIQMYILIKGILCSAILYIVGHYFYNQLDKQAR